MVAHAAEYARIRLQTGQRLQAILQRIASGGDQVAGDQSQMRPGFIGHRDGALQLLHAQERAQVNIG